MGALLTDLPVQKDLLPFDIMALLGFTLSMLLGAFIVAYLERPLGNTQASPKAEIRNFAGEEDENFKVLARKITPDTFYNGWHFSRRNYTLTAITHKVDYQGNKPVRHPKYASEAMIADTEKRLSFKLPDTLRQIYKLQDGGSLPAYFAPKFEGAPPNFEDWISAFAHDYDVLNPLGELTTLYDLHMEHFDPEYSSADEKEGWISGCEKLVILAIRTGYGTALDYRSGGEPGILLFDNGMDEAELKKFESFDAFLAACHEIDFDYNHDTAKNIPFGTPPNPNNPDRFWDTGNSGAGITQTVWAGTGAALGVTLPEDLRPFYSASNGGTCKFSVTLGPNGGVDDPLTHPFPSGPYVQDPFFLKLEHWAALSELSDRLDFIDNRTPWRDLYKDPEKLIVISGAFDMALLLDYRGNLERPAVMAVKDLDDPQSAYVYPSVLDFLTRLRPFGVPAHKEENEIGDMRISSRSGHAQSFWMPSPDHNPVADNVITGFNEKWGLQTHGLPGTIKNIYQVQNGGAVRFRFAPPITLQNGRRMRPNLSANPWNNVFEDGLLPMEAWQTFEQWRQNSGLAMDQSIFDFVDNIVEPEDSQAGNILSDVVEAADKSSFEDEDIKLRVFVIGDHSSDPHRLTLLDMSSDYFNHHRDLMTVEYDKVADRFDIIFGPVMADNIYHGLFNCLHALKDELD